VENNPQRRPPVLVAFRCPRCVAEQSVDLLVLSRAGSLTCVGCHRRLQADQVSEAIARTRNAGAPSGERPRARLWA
jgi:transcription elongation factor Elf1